MPVAPSIGVSSECAVTSGSLAEAVSSPPEVIGVPMVLSFPFLFDPLVETFWFVAVSDTPPVQLGQIDGVANPTEVALEYAKLLAV